MKHSNYIKPLIVVTIILICLVAFTTNEAKALTFSPKLFKIQQFSFNISKLKLTGILSIGFNKALLTSKISESPNVYGDCEHEYERCVGYIDQFDDTVEYLLLQAKNACVYSGESPKEKCFGLDIEAPEPVETSVPLIIPEPEPIQCTGPSKISCTTVIGLPGTQTARSCNTVTGNWNFGICLAETISTPPIDQMCEAPAPTCQAGYSGSYVCQNGSWINQCQEPECNTNQPQCPVGSYGNYVCQNGDWVSQCQSVASTCPTQDPDWRVCMMPDGRYGREYTDYCNEATDEWVWKLCNVYPNLQPTCTSFTYTDWNTCSGGTQGRTILTRAPYGCAGGNPITYQTCCDSADPTCQAN